MGEQFIHHHFGALFHGDPAAGYIHGKVHQVHFFPGHHDYHLVSRNFPDRGILTVLRNILERGNLLCWKN